MKHKEIVHIIRKRFEKVNVAYQSLIMHYTAEDIHTFRVAVKKLRAFLRLLGKRKKFPLPTKLSEFYRVAGTIRNLRLQQQNVLKAWATMDKEPPAHYLQVLDTEISGNILLAKFLAKGRKNFQKEELRIIDRLPAQAGKKTIDRFLQAETNKIRNLLTPSLPTGESLHSVRKSFKNLLYTENYAGQYAAPQTLLLPYSELESQAGLLGDLQDMHTGILLLQSPYTDAGNSEEERIDLFNLRGQWLEEKERKEQEAYTLLRKKMGIRDDAEDGVTDISAVNDTNHVSR